jgi:hypothetical protein
LNNFFEAIFYATPSSDKKWGIFMLSETVSGPRPPIRPKPNNFLYLLPGELEGFKLLSMVPAFF